MNLSVRKARMGDIRAIHALLMTSSADGLLLPRSLTDLYGHLRDFFVVEGDGATVGCGALSIIGRTWPKCARWPWPPMRAGRDAGG